MIKKLFYKCMYEVMFGVLRKKYKLKYKLERAKQLNNFVLIKQNGEKIKNPNIRGLKLEFYGKNSTVEIHEPTSFENCVIGLSDNNYVSIEGSVYGIYNLKTETPLRKGSKLVIGKNLSCVGCRLYMNDEPDIKVVIGDDCMFSTDITIRPSDGHAIVSKDGKYLNKAEDIVIGNHVWLGMGAKVLKGARIPDNSVVALSSVFLKNSYKTEANSSTPPHLSGNRYDFCRNSGSRCKTGRVYLAS